MTALDRDAARKVLAEGLGSAMLPEEVGDGLLDALEGCVRPGPPHTIDRDALVRRLEQYAEECGVGEDDTTPAAASDILAMLRPVEGGVVLTREEVRVVLDIAHYLANGGIVLGGTRALVTRLEAAS